MRRVLSRIALNWQTAGFRVLRVKEKFSSSRAVLGIPRLLCSLVHHVCGSRLLKSFLLRFLAMRILEVVLEIDDQI